ncbi:MAG: radical SAM protein [Candidatus Lokiarchaeota archaeon]|nr:radical SAM protein [Candidatus Lokiarchaeota archaeon]
MSIHVYGPVPSRRLGKSLGIDCCPPLPNKTCNFNCVYCQLGRTRHFTNQRREFFPVANLIKEVERRVETVGKSNIDYLTLVGDGEPTLYLKMGELINGIKNNWGISVCVITNGALLYDEKVRDELLNVDIIMPTLDAGIEKEFKLINRPIRHINFNEMVKGMIQFRDSFDGKIWMEFMAVGGINDHFDSLEKTRQLYEKIRPDRIYVNTPIRPPAEVWVKTPSLENMDLIERVLGPSAKKGIFLINLSEEGDFYIEGEKEREIIQSLAQTIKRHPMRQDQVDKVLEDKYIKNKLEIINQLTELKIEKKKFHDKVFFVYTDIE